MGKLLDIVQTINRKTAWANGIKQKLGLWDLATKVLVKKVDSKARSDIVASLREDVIEKKVAWLKDAGVDTPLFVVLLIERLGDIVAAEPISRYLKELSPHGETIWVVKKAFRDLVEYNPYIDKVVEVSNLTEGELYCRKAMANSKAIFVNCVLHKTVCPVTNRIFANENNPKITLFTYYAIGNLLETTALSAGLPRLTDSPVFHFRTGLSLPDVLRECKYAVFHCYSNDPARDWDADKWNSLAAYVVSRGYKVVEIGERCALENNGKDIICLTGRRNLQELAFVVKNATCFIGVDSGFAHIANATRRPSVIMVGRYGNFTGQRIWSGDFAKSNRFKVVRAPGEELASAIDIEVVRDAFDELLTLETSK